MSDKDDEDSVASEIDTPSSTPDTGPEVNETVAMLRDATIRRYSTMKQSDVYKTLKANEVGSYTIQNIERFFMECYEILISIPYRKLGADMYWLPANVCMANFNRYFHIKSQVAFITFSLVQTACFLLVPGLVAGIIPDLDMQPSGYPILRLIGVFELGLMLVYCSSVVANDRLGMLMTVGGRALVVPMVLYQLVVVRAPWVFALAVLPDIVGAAATAYGLYSNVSSFASCAIRSKQARPLEQLLRLFLLFLGLYQLLLGLYVFILPSSYLTGSQPLLTPALSIAPKHVGLRSVGFTLVIAGAYVTFLAVNRAPGITYLALGTHHWVQYFGMSAVDAVFGYRLQVPTLHLHAAVIIFLFAGLVVVSPSLTWKTKEE